MTTESDPALVRLRRLEHEHSERYERVRRGIRDETAVAAAQKLRDEAIAAVQAYLNRR